MLRARLDMAIKIYNSGATDRILVSGDHGKKDYDEVGVMADYLVAAGIPDAHVFMDHAGFDTYNTVYRAQSIFCVRRVPHYHARFSSSPCALYWRATRA